MKRGLHHWIYFIFIILATITTAQEISATHNCTIVAGACPFLYLNVANVTDDGHISNNTNENRRLCCRDVIMNQGLSSFKYINGGHVSANSTVTAFPNDMRMGFIQNCTIKNACNDMKEICIFKLHNETPYFAHNSHIYDCDDSVPSTAMLCCTFKENCSDGIDNNFNGNIDCADWDCYQSWNNPAPKDCTGSPFNESTCISLTRDTVLNTYNIVRNPLCHIDDGENLDLYCADTNDGTGKGICCQQGTSPVLDPMSGMYDCLETDNCGLTSANPTYPCAYDFDASSAPNNWFANPYDGDTGDWCVSHMPNLYFMDNPGLERSDACCLIVKDGTVDYFTDANNVKIFGN